MRQMSYVFRDWKIQKRVNIFFVIQMIVVVFLTSYSMTVALSTYNGYRKLSEITNSNTYLLKDCTDSDHLSYLFENQDEYIESMRQLYRYIISSEDFNTYTFYSYMEGQQKDGIEIKQYTSDLNFIEINGIEVFQGRNFNEEDYKKNSNDKIPILVGYKLKDLYKLGNTYTMVDGGTGEEITCEVIGILKNNEGYYNIESIDQYNNLNYSYIKPLMYLNVDSLSYSDIDMAISSTVFFAENKNSVESIANKSYELGLFSFSVESFKTELDAFVDTMQEGIEYILGITIIIFIFASVGMISNLNMMIDQNMKEYIIHILCGARYKDIAVRLFLQLAISIIISIVPSIVYFGVNLSMLLSILLVILVMMGVLIIPLRKLYSTPIADLLRRNE